MRAAAVALLLLAAPWPAQAAARFAVVAGNDVGGANRARLWFAEKDADRVARALVELGDFPAGQVTVLRGKGSAELKAALEDVERRLKAARAAGERTLLLVYYSGHAGERGLELGDDRLGYAELRALLTGSSAEARVAILDACEAGRLTQVKGATYAAGVSFALPAEDAVEGTAFITSSAAGEPAQESASIGGSFFTHHLEAALRGAADADGDGKVTLAEAFHYAAARTTSNTTVTEAGPQHPTYELRMAGRGEVVLADLRRGEATLRLPADPGATWFVRGPRELFAEVPGGGGELSLALPAGQYRVERRGRDGRAFAEVALARGDARALPRLEPGAWERARSKGGPLPTVGFAGAGIGLLPLAGAGVAPLLRAGVQRELTDFALRLTLDFTRWSVEQGALRYTFQRLEGALALLWPLPAGPVLLELGAQAGYGWAAQSFASGRTASAGVPSAALVARASAALGALRVGADLSAGACAFRLDDASTLLRPAATLSLLAVYAW